MATETPGEKTRAFDKAKLYRALGYKPFREQLLYHNSRARFRCACCGRRFGKSTMAARDLEPHLFMPKKMHWIVGPTYDLGEKEFRVIWDDLIVKLQLGRDKQVKKGYNKKQGTMFLEFPWKTRLEVRSADHPENLVGEALDRVIMSEAAKQKIETWERYVRPALADKRGTADFVTTPEGFNWLYNIWALGQNPDLLYKDFESWRFPSWSNTEVYPGGREDPEIKLMELTTAPEWFLQEIAADFASFVGKIFPEWDETIHVRAHRFRPEWPNYMAIDWGYANPLAAVEFQVSPQDTIHVWREHYRAYTTLEEHVRLLKAREQPEGYHLDMAFGDAADPEAATYVSQHLVPCYAPPEAKTNWRQGIDRVRGFMRCNRPMVTPAGIEVTDEYGAPKYEPAYFVDHSCVNHIREVNNYRAPNPVKGKNVPEMGQKVEDHTIDGMRYGLVCLYDLGAGAHLSDVMSSSGEGTGGESAGTFFAMNSGGVTLGGGGF